MKLARRVENIGVDKERGGKNRVIFQFMVGLCNSRKKFRVGPYGSTGVNLIHFTVFKNFFKTNLLMNVLCKERLVHDV